MLTLLREVYKRKLWQDMRRVHGHVLMRRQQVLGAWRAWHHELLG